MARTGSYALPAPVGGWNAKSTLQDMKETEAIVLENIIPGSGYCQIRNGYRVHSPSGMGTGNVDTLFEYSGMDGTRRLIAGANGNLYNASTYNVGATDLTSGFGAFTSNQWQGVNFLNTGILVNGVDQPKQYDGTTITDAVYTGTTDNDFISVSVYKQRLYFVPKNSLSVWYPTTVSGVTGACTEFPVGDFLRKGGYLLFAGSYARDTGSQVEDLFVMVTNMGEILVFSGSYPGGASWSLVGRYDNIAAPLGRRAFFNLGPDMVVLTLNGAVVLSGVLNGRSEATSVLTDNVRNAFRELTQLYSTNYGWEARVYQRGNMLLLNIPISTALFHQFVMNLETGAWSRITGWNGRTFCIFNDKLYMGMTNGTISECDITASDNGAVIPVRIKQAFNYCRNKQVQKFFELVRPTIQGDGVITLGCDVDVDFRNEPITNTITTLGGSGSAWDTATWDVDSWGGEDVASEEWYSVSGVGRCAALKISGDFKDVTWRYMSVDMIYQEGGFI